jgi:hypothetical protein
MVKNSIIFTTLLLILSCSKQYAMTNSSVENIVELKKKKQVVFADDKVRKIFIDSFVADCLTDPIIKDFIPVIQFDTLARTRDIELAFKLFFEAMADMLYEQKRTLGDLREMVLKLATEALFSAREHEMNNDIYRIMLNVISALEKADLSLWQNLLKKADAHRPVAQTALIELRTYERFEAQPDDIPVPVAEKIREEVETENQQESSSSFQDKVESVATYALLIAAVYVVANW